MNLTANSARRGLSRIAPQAIRAAAQNGLTQHRTTRIERFLLLAIIVFFPLDRTLIPGYSISFFVFIMYGGYVILKRPGPLARILFDPLFVAAYILLALGSFIEFFHPDANYSEIRRTSQMFIGAIIIASLCRDRAALRAAMHGYLIVGVFISVYIFLISFSVLSAATGTDFGDASKLRGEVFKDASLSISYLIPINAAVVALASTLSAHAPHRRYLFLTIAVFCAIASSLTLARSAIIILIGSLAAVMFARGVWRGRTILMVGVIGAAIAMWIPDVVWSRFSLQTDAQRGHHEARVRLYVAAVEEFPEYAMAGVGAGNFWAAWGRQTNFHVGTRSVSGAHNAFIQVTIYWGLAALLALIAVVWHAYRCLPRHCGSDVLSLQLLGVSIAAFIPLFIMHSIYAKEFSLVLGLLVGARCWIWPRGIVQPATWKQRLPRPTLHASTRSAQMRSKILR
jgi:hypothetical protein